MAFAAVLLLFAFHGFVNAMVWTYGFGGMRPLLPIVAAILPVLTWYSFVTLADRAKPLSPLMLLRFVVPAAIIICVFVFPDAIDVLIVLQYLGYGAALLRLASAGQDTFKETVLHQSFSAMRAAQLTGILLILNAFLDFGIILDFQLTGGKNFLGILSIVSILILLGLGVAALIGLDAGNRTDTTTEAQQPDVDDNADDDLVVVERVDRFLNESKIFLDPNLTISLLAKKIGISSRQISVAINRHRGANVSQYINSFRLNEACNLMRTTKDSITNIHYDSGFLTKSNFNREFKRQFGCSPSEWRKREK